MCQTIKKELHSTLDELVKSRLFSGGSIVEYKECWQIANIINTRFNVNFFFAPYNGMNGVRVRKFSVFHILLTFCAKSNAASPYFLLSSATKKSKNFSLMPEFLRLVRYRIISRFISGLTISKSLMFL